jgi:signal transduction histidine kinase
METQPETKHLRNQVASLRRLVEVSLVLNSTLEQRPLLQYILDAATELTEAEEASVMLMEPNTHELFFVASTSTPIEELAKIPVPLDHSIAGTIVRENGPIVVNDTSQDPRHFGQVSERVDFQVRSLLGVPMRIRDRVVGVVEVLNKVSGGWTVEDRNHLFILASQAAVAVENARLVEALRKAYDDLSQLDKLKNDFITIASHELRTPLGVILGYASFLTDEAQGAVSEHAAAVLNSALHLRNLIEDMTNLRHLQVGEGELQKELVPLAEIVQAAVQDVASLAQAKEQQLSVRPPDGSMIVNADCIRLDMAITNLLNNAIKFTPSGGKITVWAERHGSEVWLRVRDNGVGIPADELERVFDQFYQVEDHMTRRHGGLGLGLSIAKALVEAHNGRIWAESPGHNQGSTFTIALPIAT